MNDGKQLLLEAAAIGAGYKALNGKVYGIAGQHQARTTYDLLCDNDLYWNPLVDDGDALRLACDLEIQLDWYVHPDGTKKARAFYKGIQNSQVYSDNKDKQVVSRLAIVWVAAENSERLCNEPRNDT